MLAALLTLGAAPRCVAADSFLDPSKAQEAIPYGTTIDEGPSGKDARTPGPGTVDGSHRTAPPRGTTGSTADPGSRQERRDRETDQPR